MIYLSEASDKYTYLNDYVMRRRLRKHTPGLMSRPLSFP